MMQAQTITVDLTERYDPRTNVRQMEFHRAPETYKLYGGAMFGGKTAALINDGIQLSFEYPGNFGLLMRKTWPSFRDTALPQLEKFLDDRLVKEWNHSNKQIVLINGSKIRYGGIGDGPDDWKSFMGGEYGWIALDQAEEFSETEFQMLSTRLRLRLPNIKYHFLLSCNPDPGWIKRRFLEKPEPDYIFIPALPSDNAKNLPPGYIDRMNEMLGENQRRALMQGDWEAVGAPDNVYAYAKVKAAMARTAERALPVQIGVDVARSGDDQSVIYLCEGMKLTLHNKAQGHDLMQTTGEVWRCITERVIPFWGIKLAKIRIKVDADGLGAGVVDRLREQRTEKEGEFTQLIFSKLSEAEKATAIKAGYKFKIYIEEIHGAAKASEPSRFKNLRAEIHWGLREMMDNIALPDDRELLSQLMAIKYKINSAGQIEILAKDEIKEKLGRSPDDAEAVIYTLAKPTGVQLWVA
jgi:phage terminase large subunit